MKAVGPALMEKEDALLLRFIILFALLSTALGFSEGCIVVIGLFDYPLVAILSSVTSYKRMQIERKKKYRHILVL